MEYCGGCGKPVPFPTVFAGPRPLCRNCFFAVLEAGGGATPGAWGQMRPQVWQCVVCREPYEDVGEVYPYCSTKCEQFDIAHALWRDAQPPRAKGASWLW